MDGCSTYKKLPKKMPNLFLSPPYCRKAERYKDEFVKEAVSMKFEVSDPGKVLYLCENLSDDNTRGLEVKINSYLERESNSEHVFFVNLFQTSEDAVIRVIGQNYLEPEIRVQLDSGDFAKLPKKFGTFVDIEEWCPDLFAEIKAVYHKADFNVVTIPLVSIECNCPKDSATIPYMINFINSHNDEGFLVKLVRETFCYCSAILNNTRVAEEEFRLKEECQKLLGVARRFFSHLGDVNDLLKEIMTEARQLTNAERCSLFLMDPDHMHLVAKVFDDGAECSVRTEVRLSKDQGIAGHVAATGKIVNIKNAYEHPLFYKGMDKATGFRTRNILSFPIRDEQGIVGVAQLCNKKIGNFNYFDEEVAKAFSIYCGLSIVHSLVYRKVQDARERTKLSNELMIYHMKVSTSDVMEVLGCERCHYKSEFYDFSFSPREVSTHESICFILKMYEDMGLVDKFKIKRDVLVRFLLHVQRGYREEKDAPYHNWTHAFATAHFAYLCMRNLRLVEDKYLTELDVLAFFTAAICHDVDHRGTTNSFQMQTGSTLANLYSSEGSVMERHHLAQTLCILNTENCNFLECLDNPTYTLCLDILRDVILATDLAHHIQIAPAQMHMVQEGYNSHTKEDRYLLLCLLMTCADLSDQTKDWLHSKRMAKLLYEEFFKQGDLLKLMGKEPLAMMDRNKASIPELQIEFLNEICMPVFSWLALLFPTASELSGAVEHNVKCWEFSKPVFMNRTVLGDSAMDILVSSSVEKEVLEILKNNDLLNSL